MWSVARPPAQYVAIDRAQVTASRCFFVIPPDFGTLKSRNIMTNTKILQKYQRAVIRNPGILDLQIR